MLKTDILFDILRIVSLRIMRIMEEWVEFWIKPSSDMQRKLKRWIALVADTETKTRVGKGRRRGRRGFFLCGQGRSFLLDAGCLRWRNVQTRIFGRKGVFRRFEEQTLDFWICWRLFS